MFADHKCSQKFGSQTNFSIFYYVKKKLWPKWGHGRFDQGVNMPLIPCDVFRQMRPLNDRQFFISSSFCNLSEFQKNCHFPSVKSSLAVFVYMFWNLGQEPECSEFAEYALIVYLTC